MSNIMTRNKLTKGRATNREARRFQQRCSTSERQLPNYFKKGNIRDNADCIASRDIEALQLKEFEVLSRRKP